MVFNVKTGSGRKKKIDSKHSYKKCKKTKSKTILTNNKKIYVVSYKKEGHFIKSYIDQVEEYLLPYHKSKRVISKGTLLKTQEGDIIRVTSINKESKHIVGLISTNSIK